MERKTTDATRKAIYKYDNKFVIRILLVHNGLT